MVSGQYNAPLALCYDDCRINAPGARLTRCFNFTGQSVTEKDISHYQQAYLKCFCQSEQLMSLIYLSSSDSVGTLWYQCVNSSSVVKTQFLHEDCRSRIWAKTSNSCKQRNISLYN